jgi:tRNA modification GTPase
VLVVLDGSGPLTEDDRTTLDATQQSRQVVAVNKSDLPAAWPVAALDVTRLVLVSAKTGEGLHDLRAALVTALTGREWLRDVPAVTNVRHAELLKRARAALERARRAAVDGTPEEFVLQDINDARSCFEEVTGRRTADDVLHAIFDRFCIGK